MNEFTPDSIPQGGFVTRMMPPIDWHWGELPTFKEVAGLSKREIELKVAEIYLKDENVDKLVEWLKCRNEQTGTVTFSDQFRQVANERELLEFEARNQLSILAEIDGGTLWVYATMGIK